MEIGKPQLYLNMIIGDFEPVEMVQRSIDSVKNGVDGMYITVTYKETQPKHTHPLLKLLRKYKANISLYKWTYNFAEARQFALEQVPTGPDKFIYWQDADDVLVGAEKLKGIVDDMFNMKQSGIYFDYWYNVELDENGEVKEIIVKHKRERIVVNNFIWKWVGPLHETLVEQQQENLVRHFRPDCHVIQLSGNMLLPEKLERNIEILEATAKKEEHRDPRTLIYLAKAYFDKAKMFPEDNKISLDLALNLFHEYLEGSGTPGTEGYREPSGWNEERSTAWEAIAEIAILKEAPVVALGAYQNAIDEAPQFPNYYAGLAMCYVLMGDFKKARHWLNVCTSIPEPDTTIILLPRDLKIRALSVSYEINIHDQKLDWALKDAEELYKLVPDEHNMQRVINAQSLDAYNKVCQSYVYIGKYLEDIKQKDSIVDLVKSIPPEMQSERFATEMKTLFLPAKKWESNEIAIICGPGVEKWDPDSAKTGIGGSEEAVINMSKEWAKLGWKVTVYGDPVNPGDFDGVQYRSWNEINRKDEFNVLILWRNIGFVDIEPKAKFIMVWMHDMPNNPDFTEERVNRVDKIAVLSEYHQSQLRMNKKGEFVEMPAEKVFVTSNGIVTDKTPVWKGNPHRLIYMSSPDRGLVHLLGMWPDIRKEVPDAELHVFYGWAVFDAINRDNPAKQQWKEQVMQMMNQEGIINHGRVGHKALHEEISKSGIWAYPTHFTEISCISAMKAQKYGAVPVVTDFAALSETVKNGLKVDVDITTPEGKEEYLKALVGLLKDEKKQEDIRTNMMKWADHYFDWDNVAKLWAEIFNIKVQKKEV